MAQRARAESEGWLAIVALIRIPTTKAKRSDPPSSPSAGGISVGHIRPHSYDSILDIAL
jgi:hypothetical protein